MKKNMILLVLIIAVFLSLKAVPAFPNSVEYKLPDGSIINITLNGDEKVNWAQTLDGYTLFLNEEGFYEYAVLDSKGDLMGSGIRAYNENERNTEQNSFLASLQKHLNFSESQIDLMRQIWDIKDSESSKGFPATGNRKLVCILMSFTDKPFTKTMSAFNNLFNQVGYSSEGGKGSIKDLYLKNSYNQLNLTTDVVGPYPALHNIAYYGNNTDGKYRELISEAVNKANPAVNYANYDNDNDGNVDGIYVIFAGYGEEAGGGADCIWSHKSGISAVTMDGVKISTYACSPELRGGSGTNMTHIGVIAHEFGHVMGSRDFYDTNGATGGSFTGTGGWDLMAGGSWNGGGATPAYHNPYNRVRLFNWAPATTLTSAQNVTVQNSEQNKSFYRIDTQTANEYYLIENRQKVDMDLGIPGNGLIIFHVNEPNLSNQTYPQGLYPVCASATTNPGTTSSTYGSINSAGCPFPGSSNKTSFTDATTPNMKSWAGANTNKPITNIVHSNGVVSFDFMGGAVALRNPENPANTVNGLDYKYYHGTWNALPNFNALTPVKTGTVSNYDISVATQGDNFGFAFTGYVNVPTDGVYTFYTSSDDGSKLYIGTTLVVANDGLHGTVEKSGQIGLKAGKHAVRVEFFEKTGGNVLQVRYQGSGISKQLIPNSALYRVQAITYYYLTVDNGNGDGNYTAGANATITAATPPAGQVFDKWVKNSGNPTIANINAATTTLTMPASAAKVTASYKNIIGPAGYTWCASEGQSYTFNQVVDVAYGANGIFNYKYGVTGTVNFNNGTFGDPIPGVVKAGYYKLALRTPENPAYVASGLDYKYYHGTWSVLPNFNALTPVKAGTVNNYDISVATQGDNFGFVFTGFVNVPSDGSYTFFTSSDDGSKLYIGTTLVVANDGLHGTVEKSGQIGLKAGKHAVKIEFFERTGGNVLQVRYQGPGISKQLIPNSALYRVPNILADDVLGSYIRQPILNNWHSGVIEMSGSTMQWRNTAGVTWTLIPDLANEKLLTTSQCPYYSNANGKAFTLKTRQNSEGRKTIEGFWFLNELYSMASNNSKGKVTSQSSTYPGGVSSRAVDGNTDGVWAHNSVTHTQNNSAAWWKVDLGSACDISSVIIWNRVECSNRLTNFHVDYLNQSGVVIAKKDYPGTAGNKTVIDMSASGVFAVRIQLYGSNYLSLAEVQVIGAVGVANANPEPTAEEAIPQESELAQNYPNPFNPVTTISFALTEESSVKLVVMNSKGETVKVLANGFQNAGNHSFSFDGSGLNSGMYFYQLITQQRTITKKMILVK